MRATIGVLMLETQFPRIPGDIGNASSFADPVVFRIVRGATVPRIATPALDRNLLQSFIDAAEDLERECVRAITTSCGFLVLFQKEIAERLHVPFFASSLLQIPIVFRIVGRPLGVITANSAALTHDHLRAAGVNESMQVVIAGLEDCPSFASTFLQDSPRLDFAAVEREVVGTAEALLRKVPDIGAFVCECHNLAPYGPAIQWATERPVFDIFSLIAMVKQAITKPAFPVEAAWRRDD
jgi:hypothetical protein